MAEKARRQLPFDVLVELEASGEATPEQLAILEAEPAKWLDTLLDRLAETDDALKSVRSINGPERAQVVADFESERSALAAAVRRLGGGADALAREATRRRIDDLVAQALGGRAVHRGPPHAARRGFGRRHDGQPRVLDSGSLSSNI